MSGKNRLSLPFRAVLLLLPRHVRAEHGDELRQFIELEAPASRLARVRYWFATLLDVLRASPSAHLDILRQDLVLALRQLRRTPGYAIIASATLAAGIAGNAALFTLVDHTLLQPAPFVEADRLVSFSEEHRERGLTRFGASPANFRDFAAAADDLIDAAAVWHPRSGTAMVDDRPERVSYAAVSSDFFRVFGEAPVLGRRILAEDDVPAGRAVVISHSFWTERLGGGPEALSRRLNIEGVDHPIVGVMPEGFSYPGEASSLWIPLGLSDEEWARRGARYVGATIRLREGVEPEALADRMSSTALALGEQFPETNGGWSTSVIGLRDAAALGIRTPLLLIWLAAGFILLIAVANVASLLLGRAVARREEMALRRALGARSGRLVRQTLTEGAVLAALAGGLGLGLASLLLAQLRRSGVDALPRVAEIGLDARALAFTALLTALVTLVFSVVPAVLERGLRPMEALRGRRVGRTLDRARLQGRLVVGEIALAIVVAVGTALLARSATRLLDQPLGYVPAQTTTFRIEPPMRIEPNQPLPELLAGLARDRVRAAATYVAFLDRLRAEPGVSAAGAVSRLPLTGRWWVTGFEIPGASGDDDYVTYIRVVTPGYFEAMGTRLLAGRGLESTDVGGAERAIVIDDAFARRYFPGGSPLGRVIHLDGPPDEPPPQARIVGVVETVRQANLDDDPRPTYYISLPQALEGHAGNWGMDVVLRHAGPPPSAEAIRGLALDFFPDGAVFRVLPIADLVSASFAERRLQLALFSGFAALALALTGVGVFGVLALHVRERSREFGVRMALGATPGSIRWLVQRDALACVAWGSAIGLVAAALLGRAFESLVYGISVYDPVAFLVGPLALGAAALVAGLGPAWSATRADPTRVLRGE